ncbi:hypothetical protein IHN63_18710, partial [Deinococcus sp. 6YEL10]|uniref:hypothetical protein n=3 Tax=unclassified Deinococcus TaxID=2623546 RepID=UPI001E28FBBC
RTVTVTPRPAAQTGTPTPPVTPPVQPAAAPSVVSFSASPRTVRSGASSTLSWNVKNAERIQIEGLDGSFPARGSVKVSPAQTTTYTLLAGSLRSVPQTVTVTQAAAPESPYSDLIGSWTHPFGYLTILNIDGRRASGTFASNRDDIPDLPIDVVFSGGTLTISSRSLESFKIVASIDAGRKILRGPYTLRGQSERWCAYRPTIPRPDGCE